MSLDDASSARLQVCFLRNELLPSGFQLDHCLLRVRVFCMPEKGKSSFLLCRSSTVQCLSPAPAHACFRCSGRDGRNTRYFNVHHAAFDALSQARLPGSQNLLVWLDSRRKLPAVAQALLEKELLELLTSDTPCPAPSLHLAKDVEPRCFHGTPLASAILCRQYSDYAVWQRAFLAAGEEQRCLDIWASELAGRVEAHRSTWRDIEGHRETGSCMALVLQVLASAFACPSMPRLGTKAPELASWPWPQRLAHSASEGALRQLSSALLSLSLSLFL